MLSRTANHRHFSGIDPLEKQSVRNLYLLAQVIEITRGANAIEFLDESIEILKRAWRLDPQDYQICRELGQRSKSEFDRVRFATAAVAVKPKSLYARYGLADAIAGNKVTKELTNFIRIDAYGLNIPFPKSISPRLTFKTKEGVEVAAGPVWGFDPDSLHPENLRKAAEELRAATRLTPTEMEPRVKLSFILAQQESYDEAVRESREVSRLDTHFDKELGLAKYFYLKGRFDLAINELQEVIEREKHKREALELLGMIYHEQGLKELAFRSYREALFASAGLEESLYYAMMETGKAEEVIALFRDQLTVHPKDISLRLDLAAMFKRQGNDDEAIRLYREVLELDPGKPEHLEKLARLLAKQEKLPEAIDLYRQAMKSFPQNNIHAYDLAHLLIDYNDAGGAIAVYREAIKVQPERPDLFVSLSYLLDHHGKTTEAIAIDREAIKAHPKNLEFHESLANRLSRQGKPDESNAELDTLIDLLREQVRLKEDASNYKKLGSVYLRRGKGQEAIAVYRKVIGFDSKNAETPNNFAWDLATNSDPKLRDGKAAIEFATKACELTEWKNPPYLDTLSAAYAESGDFDSAVKWQTKAIELLSDEKEKEDYRTRLKLYQEKKPYHGTAPESK
jgi:tetratricopeptide (TPR) repeat protein